MTMIIAGLAVVVATLCVQAARMADGRRSEHNQQWPQTSSLHNPLNSINRIKAQRPFCHVEVNSPCTPGSRQAVSQRIRGLCMKSRLWIASLPVLLAAASASAQAAPPSGNTRGAASTVDSVLKNLGVESIRNIDADICFPATAEEYAELGKNAIVMLTSSSAISTELPLKAVYAMRNGVRIPLQRITSLDKSIHAQSGRTSQVSFYLMPIQLMKQDARILADFNGQRRGFGFFSFSAAEGIDPGAPAFARLDEYDDPSEPDMATVQAVVLREFPDHFR